MKAISADINLPPSVPLPTHDRLYQDNVDLARALQIHILSN
jgi:hypothetical protein